MSKTRDTGYLANVIQVHDTGVRIMSGSTMLMAISSSGQVTITGELSGSDAANSLLLDGTGSLAFTTTASFLVVSASQQQISSSLLQVSASYIFLSASYTTFSGSASTRISNNETSSNSLTNASASFSIRTTQVEKTYATTGSNTYTGTQNFSSTCTPNGFNSGASLYTAGGLQVTNDAYFSSSVFIKGNVTVYGTQSVAYISSSQLNIGTNTITVNTFTPSVRFGGLSVFDSGSTGLTGSIFWDSELNRWIYVNASGSGGGATYGGGMFISGPRNTQGMGCEQGTTACMLLVGQGGDHLTSSLIYHDSAVTCIPNTFIGGVGCFSGQICGGGATFANTVNITNNTGGAGLSMTNTAAPNITGVGSPTRGMILNGLSTTAAATGASFYFYGATNSYTSLTSGDLLQVTNNDAVKFRLDYAGAATFSSSVTAARLAINGAIGELVSLYNVDSSGLQALRVSNGINASGGIVLFNSSSSTGTETGGLLRIHQQSTSLSQPTAVFRQDGSADILRLQGAAGALMVNITSTGAATFSGDVTVSGNLTLGSYVNANITLNTNCKLVVRQASMTLDAVTPSYFGYSSGYGIVKLGSTDTNRSLAFNVDVTGNPSGDFGGNGSEYVWRNVGSFITPNAANNNYNKLFNWNSSGQLTITNAATFSSNVNVYDGNSRGLSISNSSGAITFTNNWGKTTFTAPSAQDIEFNDDAGVKRLFLKNGGNVGIGTTSPTSKFFLLGAGSYNTSTSEILTSDATIFSSEMTNDAYNSILQLVSVRQSLSTGQGSNGFLGFSTIDDSNGEGIRDAGRIAIVNETGTTRNSATALSFWTNPGGTKTTAATEKMRITSGGDININMPNSTDRSLSWYSANGVYQVAAIKAITDPSYNDAGILKFFTAGTSSSGMAERMRITSAGEVYVNGTTADIWNSSCSTINQTTLGNANFPFAAARAGQIVTILNRTTTNGVILEFKYNGSVVGSISTNANSLPSDLNFKKDITNMSLGLDLITKLRPVHYRHKMDDDNEALSNGIIAQELEQALLDCGIEKNSLLMLQYKPNEKEGESQYWVDYTKMIPVLVKAIQEQQCTINTFKTCLGIA